MIGTILSDLQDKGWGLVDIVGKEDGDLLQFAKQLGQVYRFPTFNDGIFHIKTPATRSVSESPTVDAESGKAMAWGRPFLAERLKPHTDGSFIQGALPSGHQLVQMTCPPRYVLLQCIVPSNSAHSIFVDSRAVLADIERDDPDLMKLLFNPNVAVHLGREGRAACNIAVLEILDQEVTRIRYDIDSLYVKDFVKEKFQYLDEKYFENPKYVSRVSLKAGETLVVDNWRMLHGREAVEPEENSEHRYMKRVWVSPQQTLQKFHICSRGGQHLRSNLREDGPSAP